MRGQELPITQVGCGSSSRILRAHSPFPPPAPFPPPHNLDAHPSPHPRGLISPHPPPGSSWSVRPPGAARCPEGGPSPHWRWLYPILTRARQGGQRRSSCGQRGQRRRSGRGPRVYWGPCLPKGPAWSDSERGGRCQRGLAAGLRPRCRGQCGGRSWFPAAGCDRPGQPAAAFCRAGLARSAAAGLGRAGPPRPAGILAAVIPPPTTPQPCPSRAPPTTLPMAACRGGPYPFTLPALAD